MIFVLSKLGWALVRPGNLLALMLILGLMFQAARRPPFARLGRSLVTVSVLLVAALTLVVLANLVLAATLAGALMLVGLEPAGSAFTRPIGV